MDIFDKIEEMEDRRWRVKQGGGDKRIEAQHNRGKQTARERIDMLLDEGSFVELNPFIEYRGDLPDVDAPGEGVVTGYGKIDGRLVFVFAQDFTVYGGALGEMHALKITKMMDLAAENGAPVIGLNDSGGARIQEGVLSLDGYGHIFYRNSIFSGVIPQISVIMGPCAGGAVYSPAITDFVFMVEKTSQMFITGPKVIQSVTGAEINAEDLGGAKVHSSVSGNAHFTSSSEEEVLQEVRRLISFLPLNNQEKPPKKQVIIDKEIEREKAAQLVDVVPVDGSKAYDVRKVINLIVDDSDFMEVQKDFAKNIVIGFGRIDGDSVGIIANQPKFMAGGLDIDSSDKCSRFIRFCDCFNIPIITFEDVSGFIPGVNQEHNGIIRHGAKILYAYSEATVPKLTVILRKAYGGAYVALNSKAVGADLVFAWPCAEIAVMGPQGAANIIYSKEIKQSENPEATRAVKIEEYRQKFANPYVAASSGMVDDVIHPADTKERLRSSLEMLRNKKKELPKKKHGNIPLSIGRKLILPVCHRIMYGNKGVICVRNETKNKLDNILEEFAEFPIPTYEEWRHETEKSLKGASFKKLMTETYEGITLKPMYQEADIHDLKYHNSLPGQVPYLRGSSTDLSKKNSWLISQEIAYPIPEKWNEILQHDLAHGQTMIHMVLDKATLHGVDADLANEEWLGTGLSLSTHDDFCHALRNIDVGKIPVFIDAGSISLPVLSHYLAYVKEQNHSFEILQGCIGMDPLGSLVENGTIPYELETCYEIMTDTVKWAGENKIQLQTILAKGQPYHNGGASAVEELAFTLATAVEYVRVLQKKGIPIDQAAAQIRFSFSIGSNVFMEIAKLRAARVLWATIIEAFGGDKEAQKMVIHARTSSWNKTIYDPYVNMLRTTSEAFSAAVGGVDSLHVSPFDEAVRDSTAFSRRIARNTQLILQEESHLAKIMDPAGGSWYVEKLTDEVAEKAWSIFQEVEGNGGMETSLLNGFPQKTVASTASKRRSNIEQCKDVFVGVNRYPNAAETLEKDTAYETKLFIQRKSLVANYKKLKGEDAGKLVFNHKANLLEQAIDAVINNRSTIGTLANALKSGKQTVVKDTIIRERGAEPFETLRRAVEVQADKTDNRPGVFLANLGKVATFKSRSDFAAGFFEAGGFKVYRNNGYLSVDEAVNSFKESKSEIVVICLKDENDADTIVQLIRGVKQERFDAHIYVAGLPFEENQKLYSEQGVIDFIHLKANCYEIINRLLTRKGWL